MRLSHNHFIRNVQLISVCGFGEWPTHFETPTTLKVNTDKTQNAFYIRLPYSDNHWNEEVFCSISHDFQSKSLVVSVVVNEILVWMHSNPFLSTVTVAPIMVHLFSLVWTLLNFLFFSIFHANRTEIVCMQFNWK